MKKKVMFRYKCRRCGDQFLGEKAYPEEVLSDEGLERRSFDVIRHDCSMGTGNGLFGFCRLVGYNIVDDKEADNHD